ncbi:hypothetical protein RN001_000832 [Aquatica leii]|uniref:Uncharacterized protein n=1 Tax=Aquatica leii TaxID=1421715 RepID=A0AAN7PKK9_9COLE|nr:hypothetical protein RN001_000832 [Aquatica leii]
MPEKKKKRSKKSGKEKEKELKPVFEIGEIDLNKPLKNRFDPNDPVLFDLTLPTFEKDFLDQERERVDKLNEKKSKEELVIDRRKKEIKAKVKEILKIPPPPKYQPIEPVRKSEKLKEYEKQIRKDALRRKIITGQNVLGSRIEHYIPTLEAYEERMAKRKRRPKGVPVIKKRVRVSSRLRYVAPFFDDDMENHTLLKNICAKKGRGKGQYYCYEVTDKNCALVLPFQMEKCIRDKQIIDVIMAQRSEKIVVRLSTGERVTMPLAKYEGKGPLYRGSGWTKETIEEEHHHGKETFSLAKLFEAKEQGVEEWELEMMRLANKRKKKLKGEDSTDWKEMLSGCLENMDWDKFEEDTKQIIDEKDEIVESEDIPMAVDNMEKTMHVNEKLKQGGEEILAQLPTMKEVPEVIKVLDKGEMCELQEVSGMRVSLSDGHTRFVAGQMVKDDENEMFVPGQTIMNQDGNSEYTPGITICIDDEPTLIPGLVMGEEATAPLFLPGDSTITEDGQLQFEATEEDLPPRPKSPTPESSPASSSRSPSPAPAPTPKPRKKEEPIVIRRRNIPEPEEPVKKEKVKKRPPVEMKIKEKTPPKKIIREFVAPVEDPLKAFEERRRQQEEEEKKRMKEHAEERKRNEERKVDKLRLEIRQKYRNMKFENPPPYKPIEPVKKSKQLEELEQSILKGTFFDDENTRKIMENVRNANRFQRNTVGYSTGFNNYVGFGFRKYNLVDSGSRTLGVTRTYRVLVY